MKQDYYIWQTQLPGYIHGHAFDEIALGLSEAFKELGYDAPVIRNPYLESNRTAIVVGCNLLADYEPFFPARGNYIFYNLEQVSLKSPWFTQNYINLLGKHPVWDYSEANINELKKLGINAKLCEIGYVPALTRIKPAPAEDIDVLFFGSMNDRRQKIIDELRKNNVNAVTIFGKYGEERDKFISRAKIILNVHYYDAKVFEIVRCSYLMANKKCIVSETGKDADLEMPYRAAIDFCPYDKLTEECLYLLQNEDIRQEMGLDGFDIFSRHSQVNMLREVLK